MPDRQRPQRNAVERLVLRHQSNIRAMPGWMERRMCTESVRVLFYLLSGSCYLPSENQGSKKMEKRWLCRLLPFEKRKAKNYPVHWRREAYRVVMTCLEKDPPKRYSDCKVLLEEIRRAKRRWKRSKKLFPLSGALVLLLLLTCFGGVMWAEGGNKKQRRTRDYSRNTSGGG